MSSPTLAPDDRTRPYAPADGGHARHADGLPPFHAAPVVAIAALTLALHLVVLAITPYGVHRDELLYLAMGRHLRLWAMDFPPLIALVANASRALFGDTLAVVRVPPALAATALVVLAALLARELGGGRRAQLLSALCVLANPLFLRAGTLFQPVVLDQLTWTLVLYALARVTRAVDAREAGRWWLLLGLFAGLGLLTKFSILFLAAALLLAILVTPERRALATRWPWLALLVALLLGAPSIVGQLRLGFPVVGQMQDLRAGQLDRVTPAEFMVAQLMLGPTTLLAASGLGALLLGARWRRRRVVGWSCAFAFLLFLLAHGKGYYVGPVYPTLFAAGATLLERATDRMRRVGASRALFGGVAAVVLVFGAIALPLGVPILPPARMAEYARRLGVTAAVRTNRGEVAQLPQDYADMLGWRAQAEAVARAYHALSPAERAQAVIFGDNYGEAGALDFYGPRLGLPPAISAAGSYWFFGPGAKPGGVIITLGTDSTDLARFYDSVTVAARVNEPWVVSEERDQPVLVGRGARTTVQRLWPSLAGRN